MKLTVLARFAAVGLLTYLALMPVDAETTEGSYRVYFGTYTGQKSRGIYFSDFDTENGTLSPPQLAVETDSPSFLARHPTLSVVYAAGESQNSVTAFRLDPQSGKLSQIDQRPSGGSAPCHLSVDATGKCLLVANYGNGSISAIALNGQGDFVGRAAMIQHHGSSVNRQRQEGPHAHFILPDPSNRFVLTCDLGLDQVLSYRVTPDKAQLAPNETPYASVKPGAGARHLAFAPGGRMVYVVNEMGCSVTAFEYEPVQGRMTELQTISAVKAGYDGENSGAEIQIHPSGKFVYASIRGQDTITVFSRDLKTGKLELIQQQSSGGKTPRHFTIDPTGKWLVAENQQSDNVVVMRVDSATGKVSPTGEVIEVGAPVCALFVARR